MLTRRGFASCALCAITGFAATAVKAETPPAGITRRILQRMDGPTPEFETIVALAEIEPGFHVPRHIHPGIESAYIVEGAAVLSVEGKKDVAVSAEETLLVAARTPHQLQNGAKQMRIVSTYILEKGQPISLPA